MLNWANRSLTQKVGGLSTALLAMLCAVIVFSILELRHIDGEMQEMSQIDIPLTTVMSRVLTLQFKQHLALENVRFAEKNSKEQNEKLNEMQLYIASIEQEMQLAKEILEVGMLNDKLKIKIQEHQQILVLIEELMRTRNDFDQRLKSLMDSPSDNNVATWEALEEEITLLDERVVNILFAVEILTKQVVDYIEKHERKFILITALLGVSALVIGGFLSFRIIRVFSFRLSNIKTELEEISSNIESTGRNEEHVFDDHKTKDELQQLEGALKVIKERLTEETKARKTAEKELIELATVDQLTGAFNRHKWDEQIKIETNFSARGSSLSVIMFDVDHFKQVNDNHGHDVGDKVLKSLVACIKERLRESESLYRIGGEEFILLLRGCDLETTRDIAEELRAKVVNQESELPPITISLGVSEYREGDNVESFVKRADNALYQAKNNGRNRVEVG